MSTPAAVITLRAALTSKPTECVVGPSLEAERGFILLAKDTSGIFATRFRAQWLGKQAIDFLKAHQQDLIPGRCVDLELHNVRPDDKDGLRARINNCQMAPLSPSWIAHEEKQRQTIQEQPST